MSILKLIEEFYPEETFIKLDGLDTAIIGVDSKSNKIIYSVKKIIDILKDMGMPKDEAYEYYEYNIYGLRLSEGEPILCEDYFIES